MNLSTTGRTRQFKGEFAPIAGVHAQIRAAMPTNSTCAPKTRAATVHVVPPQPPEY